jgi:lipoprotein-anchoring transpeptidase ErfK/SrfK
MAMPGAWRRLAETPWLTRAVKNAWAKPAANRHFAGFCSKSGGPGWGDRTKVERLMSLRIAVALAATIGAGMLISTQAEARPDVVGFRGDYSPGTIVIRTNERRLYLVVDPGHAMRYPVGVGKAGKQWAGATRIDGKYREPAWSPPAEVKRDKPSMPDVIPGGSPRNPMGVAAMTLAGGEYAIHGTNMPGSVGGFVSYGCIRMLNADITDLYQRVSVGTPVVVTR